MPEFRPGRDPGTVRGLRSVDCRPYFRLTPRPPFLSFTLLLLTVLFLAGCKPKSTAPPLQEIDLSSAVIPVFSADSAYFYIEKQVGFGPRVPGTDAHKACAGWLEAKMRSFGAAVIAQRGTVRAFNGNVLPLHNIIARFQPEKNNRILLMAHWDSRPFADHDPDPANRQLPVPGANDGASGVGVLLEIARHLSARPTEPGIDIVFFDVEDYGVPEGGEYEWKADTWCLGSQYWSKNPHVTGYYARFGILLDMVGATGATFTQEEVSRYYAQPVLDRVWNIAGKLGHSRFFSWDKTPQIIDDHRYVNEITGIPSIDIIQYDPSTESSFGSFWHTISDDMSNISRETLKAVGETVMATVYLEK